MTNAELADRICENDESAFTAFFNANYKWVYHRAWKALRCHEDAEDAASQVFVKAWQHRKKFDPTRGTFMAWFNTLCQRTIIDAGRIKQRDQEKCRYGDLLLDDDEFPMLQRTADNSQSALDGLIAEEVQILIEDALCKIERPQHRLAWMLRHFEGYDYREIAKILKKSQGTCKIWVYRCNELLQRGLTQHA